MCFGYTVLANRQRSGPGRLRVIEWIARRVHVDEFQADLDICSILFQLDASSGFKRYFVAGAYFCIFSYCSGVSIRFGIITACNAKRPAFLQFDDIIRALVHFVIQCFQLCYVHRVGVFTACGDTCDLAGYTGFFVPHSHRGLGTLVGSRNFSLLFLSSR